MWMRTVRAGANPSEQIPDSLRYFSDMARLVSESKAVPQAMENFMTDNLEAARKLLDELKAAYQRLPTRHRYAVRKSLTEQATDSKLVISGIKRRSWPRGKNETCNLGARHFPINWGSRDERSGAVLSPLWQSDGTRQSNHTVDCYEAG